LLAQGEQTKPSQKEKEMQTMRITSGRGILINGFLLIASAGIFIAHTANSAVGQTSDGPTKENALAAEKELARAMRTNDADGVCRLLDPDWTVVDGIGRLNDRESVCAARVRVYGNTATITFPLSLSGPFEHKTFSGKEVETDVLRWEGGGWKCVLTHETNVQGTLVIE
jgi:ketosteroid isomerase-like protein